MDNHLSLHRGQYKPGQTFIMLAVGISVLIFFAGLAIDFGIAYTEQTALSRAVDAAALEGMRNLGDRTLAAGCERELR